MKTSMMLCVTAEVPDGYHMELTSEPIKDGGYLYAGHLYHRSREAPHFDPIHFDLSDVTAECQRTIEERIQKYISQATTGNSLP